MTLKTTKGNWKVNGINLIASDAIAIDLTSAIEAGNLEEAYLQKLTGSSLPIHVNEAAQSITFANF